jgi:hypothetical protein
LRCDDGRRTNSLNSAIVTGDKIASRGDGYVVRYGDRVFSTWAAAAFAAIGKLPDTWMDRSIIIYMQRKKKTEIGIERFTRQARQAPIWNELSRKCARLAQDNLAALTSAQPQLPEELDDRARDYWEPLLAIADLSGERWSLLARLAARTLSKTREPSGDEDRIALLSDIRDFFTRPENKEEEKFLSREICAYLGNLEDRPWPEFGRNSEPISPTQLARMLNSFQVRRTTVAVTRKGRKITLKGYKRSDFNDTFARYIAEEPGPIRYAVKTPRGVGETCNLETVTSSSANGSENTIKPHGDSDPNGLTDRRVVGRM